MFGLMRTSTHEAIIVEKDAVIIHLTEQRDHSRSTAEANARAWENAAVALEQEKARAKTSGRLASEALKERDEARTELARWKPQRDAKGHFVKAEA